MPTTILLADDHTMFREALVAFLTSKPQLQLLAQATNGDDAWRLIQELQPDVTVVDITMPGLSGIDIARNNVEAGRPTHVIVLTMHNDQRLALEAQQAGVDGFVLKENTLEELITAIDTVMAGRTFITPSLRSVMRTLRASGQTIHQLSDRERQVLSLIAEGNSSKEIARTMDISPRTVETYRKRLGDKLGVASLAEMVRYAVRAGLVM